MNQNKPSLRFDHREIAVIFSLFIFVTLLMFTVGILVGKGLTQAKVGSISANHAEESTGHAEHGEETASHDSHAEAPSEHATGTMVSTNSIHDAKPIAKAHDDHAEHDGDKHAPPVHAEAAPAHDAKHEPEKKEVAHASEPLKLIPKHAERSAVLGHTFKESKANTEANHVLSDPKIQALLEDGGHKKAGGHSTKGSDRRPSSAIPNSFAKGKFSVQIASYPNSSEAVERVEALKKLGFPHAYFSAKQLEETKETWYRVWLGYYPDYDSARRSGQVLQERGEVKNYLVGKSDLPG